MIDTTRAATPAIPSRDSNPFATCWTRPGALPFRFRDGTSAAQLLARLAQFSWRAAIVGPHGSGKSTLLESLKPLLTDSRKQVIAIALHDRQRRLPSDFHQALEIAIATRKPEHVLAIIDGYEQLTWFHRWLLVRRCRRIGCGLLVTAHAATRLPSLIELSPDRALISQLVTDLSDGVSNCLTPEIVAASHACHGSNVREIFFDLYDRYERSRRAR